MVGRWNPTNHTVSDFRDWDNDQKLVIQPDFQRKALWSKVSKIMLIDTILRGYPIPKIFIQNSTEEDGRTVRKIIDGQQRVTALMEFVSNKFQLEKPYDGQFLGSFFSDLPSDERNKIMQYVIDCNEAYGYSETEYREIYTRLNKYTVPLNSQELRKAEFSGSFYRVSDEIASLDFLNDWKIFTVASRRRLLDVEFVSEILAALLEGPQDKKTTLDDFYRRYDEEDLSALKSRVFRIFEEIKIIFPLNSIASTRFRQKSDFYSLVLAIDFFLKDGFTLAGKNLIFLKEDFAFLNESINPSEDYFQGVLQEYAIRCISSANTLSSRRWRVDFIKLVIAGTYLPNSDFIALIGAYKEDDYLKKFIELYDARSPIFNDSGSCILGVDACIACNDEVDFDEHNWALAWRKNLPLQISNLNPIHKDCLDQDQYLIYQPSFYKEKEPSDQADLIQDLFGDAEHD